LLAADAANPGLGLCVGRPGLAFRIEFVPLTAIAGNTICLATIVGNQTATAVSTNVLNMYPIDWPDMLQFLQKITRYRPVASSAWVAYEGSELNDGGEHSCIMYRGGEHPNTVGIYNYGTIAETPENYEGKLKDGSYQYWLPVSTNDTDMRRPVNSEEWTHPYMSIAGLVATPTQLNAIRMRGFMIMEFVSASQLWAASKNRPNPAMIEAAVAVLHNAPTSMPNDTHLRTIYNWIKNAAKDTIGWGKDNASWIIPAIGAGAALLA